MDATQPDCTGRGTPSTKEHGRTCEAGVVFDGDAREGVEADVVKHGVVSGGGAVDERPGDDVRVGRRARLQLICFFTRRP